MPKIVDKSARREAVLDVTWRIIERDGIDAVTLRRVAAEQGLANGAVKPYFASKDELLQAAYLRAFRHTNERAATAIGGHTGVEAMRRLCLEIMPLDQEQRTEAAVVVAFWEQAAADETMAEVYRSHTREWATQLGRYLAEARAAGEASTPHADADIVDELIYMMTGLQALCRLAPDLATPDRQRAALERILSGLSD